MNVSFPPKVRRTVEEKLQIRVTESSGVTEARYQNNKDLEIREPVILLLFFISSVLVISTKYDRVQKFSLVIRGISWLD